MIKFMVKYVKQNYISMMYVWRFFCLQMIITRTHVVDFQQLECVETMALDNIWQWWWWFHCFGVSLNNYHRNEYFQWYKDDNGNVMSGKATLNLQTHALFTPESTSPTRLWHLNSFWWFNGTLFFWTTTVIFLNKENVRCIICIVCILHIVYICRCIVYIV